MRCWQIQDGGAAALAVYANTLEATPLGTPSPDCVYPNKPTRSPQIGTRMWKASGTLHEGAWSIDATPGDIIGYHFELPFAAFHTLLWQKEGSLIDSEKGPDADDRIVFKPTSGVEPPGLRGDVNATIESLYTGQCESVIQRIFDPTLVSSVTSAAAQACALKRQTVKIAGQFTSISINRVRRVDRVAAAIVTRAKASGWASYSPRYLVSFDVNYEHQVIPTDALFVQENGKWRLERLWF
jgi:hypothetical protein